MPQKINMVGRKFGRMTVLAEAGRSPDVQLLYLCRCECGNTKVVRGKHLRNGRSNSCGCLLREMNIARPTRLRHGQAKANSVTPEWTAWRGLRARCHDPKQPSYPRYGGRGITVCDRWAVFENFLEDMGRRPSRKYSIDRIDNDGPYSPENCRWATAKEQANNRHPRQHAPAKIQYPLLG